MTEVLTQEQVASAVKKSNETRLLKVEVKLRDLNFVRQYNENYIVYKGNKFLISNKAYSGFINVIGLSDKVIKRISSAYTTDTGDKFIETLRCATLKEAPDKTVIMVFSKETQTVVNFTTSFNGISNEVFNRYVDRVMNKYDMNAVNYSVDPVTGFTSVHLVNDEIKDLELGIVSNVIDRDDRFRGGLKLTNSFNKMDVDLFLQRLFCTNGMGISTNESFSMKDLKSNSTTKFFENINRFSEQSFIPETVVTGIKDSIHTPASIYEIESAHRILKESCKLPTLESEQYANSLTDLSYNYGCYEAHGIDISKQSSQFKRKAESNQSLFSLMNTLTFTGTHSDEIDDSGKDKLIHIAGDKVIRGGDFSGFVKSPFSTLSQSGAELKVEPSLN